ncbi:hypothetical protein D3C79_745820 [compost metagenome]
MRLVVRVACRQRLEVTGNGRQVGIAQVLHAVFDHIAHAAEHGTAVTAAGFKELHQLFLAPAAQAVLVVTAQVLGDPAFQWRTAGQELLAIRGAQGLFLHGQGTRGMARATMAQTLHQVGAAADYRVGTGRRLPGFHLWCEHATPDRQRPTHAHGPRDVGGLVRLRHRLHALHEVGVQGAHVLVLDPRIGRVRHGRVQRAAVLGHTFAHGQVEVFETVLADAGGIRCDVGGVHGADGGFHRQPTGERLAALGGMAGHAVTGAGQVLALAHLRIVIRHGL